MTYRYLTGLALAVTLVGAAAAQGPGPGGPGGPDGFGLLRFDANNDGKLTRVEFETGQKARFAKMDTDKDGVATRDEMRAAMKTMREEAKQARFKAVDTDGNGQLSQAELAAADAHEGPGRPHMGPGGRRDGGPDGPPGHRGDRLGRDSDGKLTFEEFAARGREAFDRADANKDGVVTIAELRARSPQ